MSDERASRLPLYRSALSGEPLTLRSARITVVGREELHPRPRFRGELIRADLRDREHLDAIKAINEFYWDSTEQDIFGRTCNVLDCDNWIARPMHGEQDADDRACHGIAGNVALKVEDEGFLHIVVFHVWPVWHERGVGRMLLTAAIREARREGLPMIKLGTTNDNLPALYFYQRAGFVIEEVVPGKVIESHGESPAGFAGIPVRDEIRMRLDL